MIKKDVAKTQRGVKIDFSGEISKDTLFTVVQNCSTGKCDCMSEETKKRVEDMKVSGEDGAVTLELTGDLSKEEIETALSNSKILNR